MKSTLLLSLAILLSLLLLSCTSPVEVQSTPNESIIPEVVEELSTPNENPNEIEPISQPTGACTPQWRCISSGIKAYQTANCSFNERIPCPLGCVNDTCRAASTCTSGFKCINSQRKGYQTEACTWINDRECDWKCEAGECIEKPANYTGENETVVAEAAEPEPAPAPLPSASTLRIGQTVTIEAGGEEYFLKLYNLQESQALLELDGKRSAWLEEGQSHTFPNGVKVTVVSIYFQQYAGGKQEIEYRIG